MASVAQRDVSRSLPALEKVRNKQNQRNDQQNMDEGGRDVKDDKAHHPQKAEQHEQS
jgi:hypothetical protein